MPVLPAINLGDVQHLFRPERVAQVIVSTESYGTPVLDRFYPEARRSRWDSVLVPVHEIQRITRAVPLVRRGSPGVGVAGDAEKIQWIEPQPIKTFDGFTAAEYNNARLISSDSAQQLANRKTQRHVEIHRNTTEALAAQSLSGTVSFPIAGDTGQVIDMMDVVFGTVPGYVVMKDWTDPTTTLADVHADLREMKREMSRRGFKRVYGPAGR